MDDILKTGSQNPKVGREKSECSRPASDLLRCKSRKSSTIITTFFCFGEIFNKLPERLAGFSFDLLSLRRNRL
jgi:hypothetical protein